MATATVGRRSGRSAAGAYTDGRGWRKSIGKHLAPNGKTLPTRFWLGDDERRAATAALRIEAIWTALDAPYWSQDALKEADAIRMGLMGENAPECGVVPIVPIKREELTVLGLIERYRRAKIDDARLTAASKHSIRCRTQSLERSPIALMGLANVGAEQLAATVAFWLNRPIAPKTEQPISAYSARMIVAQARAVFDWADAMGLWTAPRRFGDLFRLPKSKVAPIIKTATIGELTRLYGAANKRQRLFMLLALNCGFCSMEIATLKRDEIDLDGAYIRRARQKSGVDGQWKLWPETIDALRSEMATNGDLALLTAPINGNDGGQPLVRYSNGGHRVDAIETTWGRLQQSAMTVCPFKRMRKTGATMVRAIGGIEVSEQYLAHSEKSVARFYSVANPQRLTDALGELRARLGAMFA